MKYRRLLLGGFLAMGLAVTTASGALAEQIVAVNSTVESVGGQATQVTDAGQNAADTSQATVNSSVNTDIHHPDSYRYQHLYQQTSEQADPDAE